MYDREIHDKRISSVSIKIQHWKAINAAKEWPRYDLKDRTGFLSKYYQINLK